MTPYEFYKNGYYLISKYLGLDDAKDFIDIMDAFFMYRETNTDFLINMLDKLYSEMFIKGLYLFCSSELYDKFASDFNIFVDMLDSDTYKQLREE